MANIPYDSREGFIWFDGELIPWNDAKVHFLSHGLHYGSGVFEGLRAYEGNIFKLAEHTDRLLEGCNIMDIGIGYSADEINTACKEIIAKNNIVNGYIRPMVWRGSEQMGVSANLTTPHLAIAAWDWPSYFSPEAREKGISLKVSDWKRPSPQTAPIHAKACGLYMICTLAKHAVEKEGYSDALMLDYEGNVAELTGANFFMIKNGELHTPKPDNFLNGITRRTVIKLAEDNNIKVNERVISVDELKGADECFATGTAVEVTPIGKINDTEYKVGPVTKLLREEYEKLVRAPSS